VTTFKPVPFYVSNLTAGTSNSDTSAPLNAEEIAEILMTYPVGTNLALVYQFYLVPSAPSDLTQAPGSGNLTFAEKRDGKFAGDGQTLIIPFQKPIESTALVLVMFCTNNGSVTYNCHAVAMVRYL
jgi:hypothetical protein